MGRCCATRRVTKPDRWISSDLMRVYRRNPRHQGASLLKHAAKQIRTQLSDFAYNYAESHLDILKSSQDGRNPKAKNADFQFMEKWCFGACFRGGSSCISEVTSCCPTFIGIMI